MHPESISIQCPWKQFYSVIRLQVQNFIAKTLFIFLISFHAGLRAIGYIIYRTVDFTLGLISAAAAAIVCQLCPSLSDCFISLETASLQQFRLSTSCIFEINFCSIIISHSDSWRLDLSAAYQPPQCISQSVSLVLISAVLIRLSTSFWDLDFGKRIIVWS